MNEVYDLIPENLQAIQSLVAREQARLMREEGAARGPAYYTACENVLPCISPADTRASALMSWIGAETSAMAHRNGNGVPVAPQWHDENNYEKPPVKIVASRGDDPDFAERNRRSGETRSEWLRGILKNVKPDEAATIGPYKNITTARRDQSRASKVIQDLKWPRLEGDRPAFRTTKVEKVDGWYLKIKRLA